MPSGNRLNVRLTAGRPNTAIDLNTGPVHANGVSDRPLRTSRFSTSLAAGLINACPCAKIETLYLDGSFIASARECLKINFFSNHILEFTPKTLGGKLQRIFRNGKVLL